MRIEGYGFRRRTTDDGQRTTDSWLDHRRRTTDNGQLVRPQTTDHRPLNLQ